MRNFVVMASAALLKKIANLMDVGEKRTVLSRDKPATLAAALGTVAAKTAIVTVAKLGAARKMT